MSKTFNVAGFSAKGGKVSFRVANGSAAARSKVLAKDGHTQIDLIDLPTAMSKEDAEVFARKALGFEGSASNATTSSTTVSSKDTFKVTKTKAEVKQMIAPKVEAKPEPTAEELEIKEKNLRTMREVSQRLSKMRDFD